MKKFQLLEDEVLEYEGRKLFRIRALKDFGDVKAGDLGGYVQSKSNLRGKGNAWIYDDSKVMDGCYVKGRVYGDSVLCGDVYVGSDSCVYDSHLEDNTWILKTSMVEDCRLRSVEVSSSRLIEVEGQYSQVSGGSNVKQSRLFGATIRGSFVMGSKVEDAFLVESKAIDCHLESLSCPGGANFRGSRITRNSYFVFRSVPFWDSRRDLTFYLGLPGDPQDPQDPQDPEIHFSLDAFADPRTARFFLENEVPKGQDKVIFESLLNAFMAMMKSYGP